MHPSSEYFSPKVFNGHKVDNDFKKFWNWNWFHIFVAVASVIIIFSCFMYFWVAPFASAGKGGIVAASKGMEFAGQYGDSFGVLNALFSGLGFSAIIITLVHQQKQIKLQAGKMAMKLRRGVHYLI